MRPTKPFFRASWQGARVCTRGAVAVVHWSAWIALLFTLGVQIYILSAQKLTLPAFVTRQLAANAAAYGFRVDFGRTHFDPLGRILLENVSLNPLSVNEPIITVRSAFLKLDPWDLLMREVDLDEIELIGVDLLVPAMFSPTGTTSTLVEGLHATLRPRPERREWEIVSLNGRVGPLAVSIGGSIALPVAGAGTLDLKQVGADYLRFARNAAPTLTRLSELGLKDLQLELVLTPDPASIAQAQVHFTAGETTLPAGIAGLPAPLKAERLDAHTSFALRGAGAIPMELVASFSDLAMDGQARAHRVVARVQGSLNRSPLHFSPDTVELTVGLAEARGFSVTPVTMRVQSGVGQMITFETTTLLKGIPWTINGLIDATDRSGTVAAQGRLPLALLEQVGARAGIRLVNQLEYAGAPRVEAVARLGPGARPQSVEGAFAAGPVVARSVPLEAASARFAWAGTSLRVSDIILRTPRSLATGSYEMDTNSRAFRFLLDGTLQPADIDGWFRDWWSRFWSSFDFSAAAPHAGVEVAGRWGAPMETTVFVAAQGEDAALRGVKLDRVRTHLFVRPGHVDVLDFQAGIDEHVAQGSFLRIAEPGTGDLRELEFDVTSDLMLADAAQLAGPGIVKAVAPFVFEHPPRMKVSGRIEGPGSPVGEHQRIAIEAHSQGAATFYGFPLQNLRFTAQVEDDDVVVEDIASVFAGGDLRGHATLQDLSGAQRLGFDAVLTGAELGRSIQTVEDYSAERAGRPPSPQSQYQQKIAPGRLDLALSAEGTARDLYSFQGAGNAQISGAELGEINMLGILSSLLRRTLLNFSTLQLDAARANFVLQGRKLAFSEVKLTGPRAALDAQGDYYLDTKAVSFTAKIYPFEESRGLISSAMGAVLAPFSQVLEVKLTGQLANPDWAFVLGPTNLIRSILGTEPDASKPAPESPQESTPPPGD
ncbi:hypothetical protein MASR2M8_22960 [Opitutaceae bacterium]